MASVVNGSIRIGGQIGGSVQRAETTIIKEVEFCNRSEFPIKGYHKYLYIALDENAIYRYDNEKGYVILSGNGCQLDDSSVSETSTWSSKRIVTEMTNEIQTEVNNAVDNAVDSRMEATTDDDIQNMFN